MADLLKKYEQTYAQNLYCGDTIGEFYEFENRGSKLILSAPHSVRTFRNKKEKAPDLYTGALVKFLGLQNNLSVITRRRFSIAKNSITDFVLLHRLEHFYFLDIHGMKENDKFDLAIGTGILNAQAYTKQIETAQLLAEKYKIRLIINHSSYTGKFGLTGDLQKIDPTPRVLQLEWQPKMRDFYRSPQNVLTQTVPFISELACSLIALDKKEN